VIKKQRPILCTAAILSFGGLSDAETLAARLDEEGIVHAEGEKLAVGDLDIAKAAIAGWGGHRQRGRVVVEIYVKNARVSNASPDFNGVFAEGSEPKA
jgi:hypothetical protein